MGPILVRRRVAAVLATALILAGCFGDPGWSVEVHNQSDRTVLVAIEDGPTTVYYVPARSSGFTYSRLGTGQRGLRVLEIDCTVRASLDTGTAGRFLLTIGPDGRSSVRTITSDETSDTFLELSGVCGGQPGCDFASLPWPSEIVEPPDANGGC